MHMDFTDKSNFKKPGMHQPATLILHNSSHASPTHYSKHQAINYTFWLHNYAVETTQPLGIHTQYMHSKQQKTLAVFPDRTTVNQANDAIDIYNGLLREELMLHTKDT